MSLLLQQPQPPLRLSSSAMEHRTPRKDYVYTVLLVVGFGVVLVGTVNVFSRAVAYVGGQPQALMLWPAAALSIPMH